MPRAVTHLEKRPHRRSGQGVPSVAATAWGSGVCGVWGRCRRRGMIPRVSKRRSKGIGFDTVLFYFRREASGADITDKTQRMNPNKR